VFYSICPPDHCDNIYFDFVTTEQSKSKQRVTFGKKNLNFQKGRYPKVLVLMPQWQNRAKVSLVYSVLFWYSTVGLFCSDLVRSNQVRSGLVWTGLVWSCLVWSGGLTELRSFKSGLMTPV
jgi:hypothetical protein